MILERVLIGKLEKADKNSGSGLVYVIVEEPFAKMKLLAVTLAVLTVVGVTHASISVYVKVRGDEKTATFSGEDSDYISDRERTSFHLDDRSLKDSIYKYVGGTPDDAYIKSPTPWGDLFVSYGWSPVRRLLRPIKARVLTIHSEPDIVAHREFINNSTYKTTYNADLSQEVADTVSSSWSRGGELSVSQEINYGFELAGAELGGSTTFEYRSSWGEDHSRSKTVTMSSSAGVSVELQPGQAARAELTATRGHIDVEVEYEATVDGDVACNYDAIFKGHHFWRYNVNAVLNAGGHPTTITSKEVMKIGFYTDARIIVTDMVSSTRLLEGPVTYVRRPIVRIAK